jgi:hypothetical protein
MPLKGPKARYQAFQPMASFNSPKHVLRLAYFSLQGWDASSARGTRSHSDGKIVDRLDLYYVIVQGAPVLRMTMVNRPISDVETCTQMHNYVPGQVEGGSEQCP